MQRILKSSCFVDLGLPVKLCLGADISHLESTPIILKYEDNIRHATSGQALRQDTVISVAFLKAGAVGTVFF